MQVIYTDGGRANTEYQGRENYDCTVVALANAASLPYEQAHNILRKSGREDGDTHWMEQGLAVYESEKLGNVIAFETRAMLDDFLKEHPEGRFIARKQGHVFAVVDGIVHEDIIFSRSSTLSRYTRILKSWRIIPREEL